DELLRFLGQVGFTGDRNLGRGPVEAQIARLHDAVLDAYIAHDLVERKTLAEYVGEVERNSPRKRLQRQHAQQLADARLDLRETARPRFDPELAAQRRIVECAGRTGPVEQALDLGRPRLDRIGVAKLRQVHARIFHVEHELELRMLAWSGDAPQA